MTSFDKQASLVAIVERAKGEPLLHEDKNIHV
jgi:hypothetical protein